MRLGKMEIVGRRAHNRSNPLLEMQLFGNFAGYYLLVRIWLYEWIFSVKWLKI
jgi:hypothetical protein